MVDLDAQSAQAETEALMIGDLPAPARLGRFEIIRLLGRGGMGVVYEARDIETGERVALKTLLRVGGEAAHNLKREFRALAGIVHPNLVLLRELFCASGVWFFTMALVEGVALSAWLEDSGARNDPERLRAVFLQIAQAMQAVHLAGRVHCDLKPANVMVTPEQRVVVLDFGLVREYERDAETISNSSAAGTPQYMAPEQGTIRGLTPASDAYALGSMLFKALTGDLPFAGARPELMAAKRTQAAPDPRALCPTADTALAELCVGLLQREPSARPTDAQIIAALGSPLTAAAAGSEPLTPTRPMFIGRQRELTLLRERLEEVRAGRATTLLLGGPSGVGKTALLDHFITSLPRDVLVLRGRCHEREAVPYNVLDGVIDELAEHMQGTAVEARPALPRHMRALAQLFPVLERLSRSTLPPRNRSDEPRERRRKAFDALKELLLRVTDRAVVVVVVDDLHWGDTDSVRLLQHVLGPPEAPPLLFIGAYRNDQLERSDFLRLALAVDARRGGFQLCVQELAPLELDAASELARKLLRREGLSDAGATKLAADAQGFPFFILALVEHLKLHAGEAPTPSREHVTLEHAIVRRLGALSEDARRLLQVISVAGRPLRELEALEIAELPRHERLPLLSLRAAQLVHALPGELVEVYHDRIREAVTGDMDETQLRSIHARFSAALHIRTAVDPECLLLHCLGAGERDAAARAAVAAARASAQKLAFNRAVELFQTALELLPDEHPSRGELQRELGHALANAGRGAHAADAYLRAAHNAEPREQTHLHSMAVEQYLRSGRIEQGTALLRELMRRNGLRWPASRLEAIATIAWNKAQLRLRGTQYAVSPEASMAPERLVRLDVLRAAFPQLAVTDVLLGVALQTRYLREALAVGEPHRLLQGLAWEAFNSALLAKAGHEKRTLELLSTVEALAAEAATAYAIASAKMVRAGCMYFFARFEEARTAAQEAETLFRDTCVGSSWEQQLLMTFRLGAIEWAGGLEHIAREAPAQAREAKERDDRFCQGFLALSLAAARLMADAPHAALTLLEEQRAELGPEFSSIHIWVLHRTIDAYNYAGQGARALEHHLKHWDAFANSYLYRCQPLYVLAHWFRVKSSIGAAVERPTPANLVMAERSTRLLERTGRTEAHCLSLLSRAAIAHLRADADSARRHLLHAVDDCAKHQCGLLGVYAKRNLGVVLGGDEGDGLITEADAALRSEGVCNPARWVATYAPGFVRS